jgi:hypothetical protein
VRSAGGHIDKDSRRAAKLGCEVALMTLCTASAHRRAVLLSHTVYEQASEKTKAVLDVGNVSFGGSKSLHTTHRLGVDVKGL